MAEYDPTITPGLVGYEEPATNINVALDYKVSNTVHSSVSFERGNYIGVKFIFTDNIKTRNINTYSYQKVDADSKIEQLIVNLQNNGISLEEISYDEENQLVLGMRQVSYQSPEKLVSVLYKLNQDIKLTNKDEITIKNYVNGFEVSNLNSKIKTFDGELLKHLKSSFIQ